ncbi:MAG: hypothetical protein RL347_1117 [Actinomycetota bacterium]|jgi:hypothetical protein
MRPPVAIVTSALLLVSVLVVAPTAEATPPVQPRALISVTVDNAAQLDALFDDTVKWQGYAITLSNDIDMAGITLNKTIGDANRPFTSTFDGNGKTISNLTVNITSAGLVNAGMFGALDAGHVIKNLTLTGSITGTSTGATVSAGGLAGYARHGEIRNVTFRGDVTGASGAGTWVNYVGGLVGSAQDDTITQALVDIDSSVTARLGRLIAGGLIGYAGNVRIEQSASYATVAAEDNTDPSNPVVAGGLVGWSDDDTSLVQDSYALGDVSASWGTGRNDVPVLGGLIGSGYGRQTITGVDRAYSFGVISQTGFAAPLLLGSLVGTDDSFSIARSFYDDTTAYPSVGSITAATADDTALDDTEQLQFASYAGVWPIVSTWQTATDDTVWGICDGQSTPYLLWQVSADPCISGNTISGTPQEGQVLTANADTAAVNDSLTYQWGWLDGGVFTRIRETPFATYTVRSADVGHQMGVRVTNTMRGLIATSISTPTSVVTAAPPPPPPPAPVFPPGAPTGVTGAPGDGSIDVGWSPPAFTGSFPISSYQVQTSPPSAGCTTSATTCSLVGLANGTTYSVQVRALNGAGWGPWSSAVDVTPQEPVEPTITITPSQRGRYVRVDGSTTELPEGTVLTAWVSMGQADFAPMPKPVFVTADGSFTWERKRNPRKQVRTYFSAYDRGVIESNTVTFTARR